MRPQRGITAIDGAIALIAVLLIIQMWLLTATLEAYLAGHPSPFFLRRSFRVCSLWLAQDCFSHSPNRRRREGFEKDAMNHRCVSVNTNDIISAFRRGARRGAIQLKVYAHKIRRNILSICEIEEPKFRLIRTWNPDELGNP